MKRLQSVLLTLTIIAAIVVVMLFSHAMRHPARAEVVTASWYHEGTRTANGERFHPGGLTAAHRTLPFGTKLRVCKENAARCVIVRINDRGPAAWTGRDLDLSRGAASVLGFIAKGITRVIYQILG